MCVQKNQNDSGYLHVMYVLTSQMIQDNWVMYELKNEMIQDIWMLGKR